MVSESAAALKTVLLTCSIFANMHVGSTQSSSSYSLNNLSHSQANKTDGPLGQQFGALGKPCDSGSREDCLFRLDHLQSDHQVYFRCQNQMCICETPTIPRAIPKISNWNLSWDAGARTCKIGEYGPCGDANNLTVECLSGFLCVQSRCRDPSKLQKLRNGSKCYDDIDCNRHFTCLYVEENRNGRNPPTKRCTVSTQRQMRVIFEPPEAENFPASTGVRKNKTQANRNSLVSLETSSPPPVFPIPPREPQRKRDIKMNISNAVDTDDVKNLFIRVVPKERSGSTPFIFVRTPILSFSSFAWILNYLAKN